MKAVLTRNILGKNASAKYALARGCDIAEQTEVILKDPVQMVPHETGLAPPVLDLMTTEGCRRVYSGDFYPYYKNVGMIGAQRIVFDAFIQQFVFADTMQLVAGHEKRFLVANGEGIWLCDAIVGHPEHAWSDGMTNA